MQTQPTTNINPSNNLEAYEFFTLIKLDRLPDEVKEERILQISQIVMNNFINQDIPQLLSDSDMAELEKMTADEGNIDALAVQEFLRDRISDFDAIIFQKTLELKKQLIINHYESELILRQREQNEQKLDCSQQISAIERLLESARTDDWDQVASTVPQTQTPSK